MQGEHSSQNSFFGVIYEDLIPADHLLRKLSAAVDFSFVCELVSDEPLALQHVYLTNISTLRLAIENHTAKPLPVEISAGTTQQALTLPATTERIQTDIKLTNPADQSEADTLTVTVTAEGAEPQIVEVPADLRPCSRAEGLQIDGQIQDWKGVPQMVLDERRDVHPSGSRAQWQGPEDLSTRAAVAWDDQYLYLLVVVADDDHRTPGIDANGFWNSDSIQVAVDVMNDAAPGDGFGERDFEYGMVVADQTLGFETVPTMGEGPFQYAGQRQEGQTIYEMAFPWGSWAAILWRAMYSP